MVEITLRGQTGSVSVAGWARVESCRGLVATMVALLAAVSPGVGVGSASATQLGPREEAVRVINLSYGAFIDYKYNQPHPYPFDFSSDGCSGPTPPEFDEPCQQHDFGYRNFGGPGDFPAGESMRKFIDDRFHAEMQRLCRDRYQGFAQQGNLRVCLYQAQVAYNAVRNLGSEAFYA